MKYIRVSRWLRLCAFLRVQRAVAMLQLAKNLDAMLVEDDERRRIRFKSFVAAERIRAGALVRLNPDGTVSPATRDVN